MELELESGKIFKDATEHDISAHIEGEPLAILTSDLSTYIWCCAQISGGDAGSPESAYSYVLEYQEGSADERYRAAEAVSTDGVRAVFVKYLRGDRSWRSEFRWEKLSPEVVESTGRKLNPFSGERTWAKGAIIMGGFIVVVVAIGIATSPRPVLDNLIDTFGILLSWSIGGLVVWAIVMGGWWRLLLPIALVIAYLALLFMWPVYTLLITILLVLLDIRRRR